MNILDENIIENQYQLLRSWRIAVRQIGQGISRKGIQDDEIIPFLLTLPRSTFFTRDLGFYDRRLCHRRYCLVSLAVDKYESANFVRRLSNHPGFNSQAKRMGTALRLSSRGIQIWGLDAENEDALQW